jgi:propionaldehyde dehydrogenase
VRVRDIDEAIEEAFRAEKGNRTFRHDPLHQRAQHVPRARRMNTTIFVKNAPSYSGLGFGAGYTTMTIATPTGEGVTSAGPSRDCAVRALRGFSASLISLASSSRLF